MASKDDLLGVILADADRLRPLWPDLSADIPAWHPRNEGDADGDGEGDGEGAGDAEGTDDGAGTDGAGQGDGEGAGEGGAGDEGQRSGEPDWKRESRKHERRAKQASKDLEEARAELKRLQQEGASEHEKALAKAREEAAAEVEKKYQTEIRNDRLEGAVLRLAAKGVKVGQGDDAKTLRFDDPEDALVFIERQIARGDIDAEDVFDDNGRVQTDALETALADLLERKPRLAADSGNGGGASRKTQGGADAGRGAGAAKDPSVEDLVKKYSAGGK